MTFCLFGFGFHKWFCTSDLLDINPVLVNPICSKCESKFRSEYKTFLDTEKEWEGNFDDFLLVHIGERLKVIATRFNQCKVMQLKDAEDHSKLGVYYEKAMNNLLDLFDRLLLCDEDMEMAMENMKHSFGERLASLA